MNRRKLRKIQEKRAAKNNLLSEKWRPRKRVNPRSVTYIRRTIHHTIPRKHDPTDSVASSFYKSDRNLRRKIDYMHNAWHFLWENCNPFHVAAMLKDLIDQGYERLSACLIKKTKNGRRILKAWKTVFGKTWSYLEDVYEQILTRWTPREKSSIFPRLVSQAIPVVRSNGFPNFLTESVA